MSAPFLSSLTPLSWEDLGLDQARTGPRVWWHQMSLRPSGAIVVSASVYGGEGKL